MLKGLKIGFALTGSFCTFDKVLPQMQKLVEEGAVVVPIMSTAASYTDTRFGRAEDFKSKIKEITGREVIDTMVEAEPLGPNNMIDIMVIAPCTGNTAAKLANAITDTAVLMATKAHLRNHKPVVISISTNDALGLNAKNIGVLQAAKNIFFVPYTQDNPQSKPNSLIADVDQIIPTILEAVNGKQIQPVFIKKKD